LYYSLAMNREIYQPSLDFEQSDDNLNYPEGKSQSEKEGEKMAEKVETNESIGELTEEQIKLLRKRVNLESIHEVFRRQLLGLNIERYAVKGCLTAFPPPSPGTIETPQTIKLARWDTDLAGDGLRKYALEPGEAKDAARLQANPKAVISTFTTKVYAASSEPKELKNDLESEDEEEEEIIGKTPTGQPMYRPEKRNY
jgi:hypothetical protein